MIEKYPPARFDDGSHERKLISVWDCPARLPVEVWSEIDLARPDLFSLPHLCIQIRRLLSLFDSHSLIGQMLQKMYSLHLGVTCARCMWNNYYPKTVQGWAKRWLSERDGLNEMIRLYSDKGWHGMRRVDNNTISIPFCENNSRIWRNGMTNFEN